MNFLENMMVKREARLHSPAFMAEMAREKIECKEVLKDLGDSTFEAGATILFKAPLEFFSKSMKVIYNKSYGGEAYAKDILKLFFGKDGVLHKTIKVTANAIHLSGKVVKISLRNLFAV